MARLFDDGSSEYLAASFTALSEPFVLAAFGYSDDLTVGQNLLSIGDASGLDYHSINMRGADGGDPVWAFSFDGSGGGHAESSTGYSANTWHHVCGLFVAADDRRVLLDGGSKGTDSDSRTIAGIDRVTIGVSADSTPVQYMSGRVAEAGIWDLSVWPGGTDSQKANEFERVAVPALAAGYSPLFFMLGLVAYYRLLRDGDRDLIGGYHLTDYNTPSIAAHPPIIYPTPPVVAAAMAAAVANAMPMAMHHYHRMRTI